MRILVVEDERRLSDALCQILSEQKYMTDAVYTGADGWAYASSGIYDCVILDVMLPGMSGFEVVAEMRRARLTTPVLLLTARGSVEDKVRGLDAGADDYMTKPFSPAELLARIRVITRRRGEVIMDEITWGDLCFSLSLSSLSCTRTEKSVRLNYKEAELVKLLMGSGGIILPKDELITRVWGYDSEAGDNNLEAYVSFIRRKLTFIGSACNVVAVKKVGYRMTDGEADM